MQNTIINNQKWFIKDLESGFLVTDDQSFRDLVSYSPRADAPIHRWFKYREGYSVDVIDGMIKKSDEKILDPFCGCGSTLLSAKKNNIPAVGIDINPISIFVSKVKIRHYEKEELRLIDKALETVIDSSTNGDVYPRPQLSMIDKAFHPEILNQLLRLKYNIKTLGNEKIRDFLFLAFLSILERVSNTYKEGNGIKYRFTKRTKNGYISIPLEEWYMTNLPENKIKFVNDSFVDKCKLMLSDVRETDLPNPSIDVYYGDARELTRHVDKNTISLCVFSPPYCNCFDYFEIFKLELWLGDFVESYEDLRRQRRKALRSNINSNLLGDIELFPYIENLIKCIEVSTLWNEKVVNLIRGYFTDMKRTLQEIYSALKSNGRCTIVVGNSAYGGILIPTDVLLAKIATEIGFKVKEIKVARHLTTSSQQKKKLADVKEFLRESLVCLTK